MWISTVRVKMTHNIINVIFFQHNTRVKRSEMPAARVAHAAAKSAEHRGVSLTFREKPRDGLFNLLPARRRGGKSALCFFLVVRLFYSDNKKRLERLARNQGEDGKGGGAEVDDE